MELISRKIKTELLKRLNDNKAIILLGPRQSGKTTLLKDLESLVKPPLLWLNGDESDIRIKLSAPTSTALKQLIGKNKTVFIDEAQRIENIGLCIKLIIDNIPEVKVIATGSSAFELANKINEPLTGRKWEYTLLPFSYEEMADNSGELNEERLLRERLIYGYYPDVVNNPGDEQEILKELSGSYLYKDIFSCQNVQKPQQLERMVQALALQLGSEVSYHELGQLCGLNNETVERYIDLLEKAFIVFRLPSFARNIRNEIKKSRKIYFYDNGLRNAIINNFNPVELRGDTGALWENFLISERLKTICFHRLHSSRYFWRTHSQQEIDYIEEYDGKIYAYEFKWKRKGKVKIPRKFIQAYPDAESTVITPENFTTFIKHTCNA